MPRCPHHVKMQPWSKDQDKYPCAQCCRPHCEELPLWILPLAGVYQQKRHRGHPVCAPYLCRLTSCQTGKNWKTYTDLPTVLQIDLGSPSSCWELTNCATWQENCALAAGGTCCSSHVAVGSAVCMKTVHGQHRIVHGQHKAVHGHLGGR